MSTPCGLVAVSDLEKRVARLESLTPTPAPSPSIAEKLAALVGKRVTVQSGPVIVCGHLVGRELHGGGCAYQVRDYSRECWFSADFGAFNVSDIQPDGHTAALILVR